MEINSTSNRVMAIIPARGNSKTIPRKNLKPLAGVPLINYTLDAVVACKPINSIFVSTEDSEIKQAALSYSLLDVKVLDRPPELSADVVQTDEVCLFALRQILHEGFTPEAVAILQPPSPFRTANDIDNAIKLFQRDTRRTVISVCRDRKFHWADNDPLDISGAYPVRHDPTRRMGRQWIAETDWLYQENGAIYICSVEKFLQERTMRAGPYSLYVMSEEASLDLDTLDQWTLAEWLIERRRKSDS